MHLLKQVVLGRPQLVTDGNKNPLLKIDGSTAEIWQYTLHLSS
jgi:hypothetical protein